MNTLKRWILAISKLTTDQTVGAAFVMAFVTLGLFLFPWGRVLVIIFIGLLGISLLGLAVFALWLKGKAAHDHT